MTPFLFHILIGFLLFVGVLIRPESFFQKVFAAKLIILKWWREWHYGFDGFLLMLDRLGLAKKSHMPNHGFVPYWSQLREFVLYEVTTK